MGACLWGRSCLQAPGEVSGCYLYSVFGQFRFHGQHLPGIDIWVVGFIECLLQLL